MHYKVVCKYYIFVIKSTRHEYGEYESTDA